jgi:aspartyl-tRNA(Asn)/glutamyl-tRNA(Gln) amidotransferase subunit B
METRVINKYEAIIGLEVHAQLKTASKLFCGCEVTYEAEPNSRTCPVCLGLPGALPVLNRKAAMMATRLILAVGGKVNARSTFARKNYFYPDLPKGYQITQYDHPIGTGGHISIPGESGPKKIGLTRIHLEEDAGKMIHAEGNYSRVDFNRCGIPLVEIVSEPEMSSPHEAYDYLTALRQILKYPGICSGDMEKGHLRCDANVSVRLIGGEFPQVKTEVKNLNSFRFIKRALECEIDRQIYLLEAGEEITAATLHWNERTGEVEIMRRKEEAEDYRYFPEPDLPALLMDRELIEELKADLPEMPDDRMARFVEQYHLPPNDAAILTKNKALADFFEKTIKGITRSEITAGWFVNELLKYFDADRFDNYKLKFTPQMVAEIFSCIKLGAISGMTAKKVLAEMVTTGKDAGTIIKEKGLEQITDPDQLGKLVKEVLAENSENVQSYYEGKEKLFDYFIGEVMKRSSGRANPELVRKILKGILDERKS